jgi:hypothetical protein
MSGKAQGFFFVYPNLHKTKNVVPQFFFRYCKVVHNLTVNPLSKYIFFAYPNLHKTKNVVSRFFFL